MPKEHRLDQIVRLVDKQGYISVTDLSRALDVSEMTIRRDLALLGKEKRLNRTFGGAMSARAEHQPPALPASENGFANPADAPYPLPLAEKEGFLLVDQVDVLVATSVDPYYDNLLLDRVKKKRIPIIAESQAMPNQRTVVAVNNYQAGRDLGRAVGAYLRQHDWGAVNLLDLTFHLPNTQTRSQGFQDGLAEVYPGFELVLSFNAQSRASTAYQIAHDALTVHPHINLIFAINDSTALGAVRACRDLAIDPHKMLVTPFGLEGDTFKDSLLEDGYSPVGLAMFPEIVSLACIDAAIAAFNQQPLPAEYITPHAVLTRQNVSTYYDHTPTGWVFNEDAARRTLNMPQRLQSGPHLNGFQLPGVMGLIVPFVEHEWYKKLTHYLRDYAAQYGIGFQIIDADQNVRDEIELRRRAIACKAASLVQPDDVVLVDDGPIAGYLAAELKHKTGITVITNSLGVFNALNPPTGITLISTGGALRSSTQVLVGPTAENALKDLRADKLFLMAGGISLDFGLSHANISEVSVKQAMIRSAREVILLADHASFSTESIIQVAPLSAINLLITDDALPPNIRLDITKLGIQLILA